MSTPTRASIPREPHARHLRVRGPAPDRGTYMWAGGEAVSLLPLRGRLRDESPVAREAMKIEGRWKQGVLDRSHHDPLEKGGVE